VAGGYWHSLALRSDGTVWSWGSNMHGTLGDGNASVVEPRTTPGQIIGLDDIISVSAGADHSLAIKADRTLWAWGRNSSAQIGTGTTSANEPTPIQVLTNVIAAAGGYWHSLALRSDGTVWAWGDNEWGQLGDGTAPVDQPSPVPVSELTGIIAISAGFSHSIALKSDGTVWAWGRDNVGQLGDDVASVNQPTPVPVAFLTDIIAIAAGGYHNLALQSDGTV